MPDREAQGDHPESKRDPPRPVRTPCPDSGLLAGHAEGRLLEQTRREVAEHVLDCAECRSIAAALARERRGLKRGSRLRLLSAAAAAAAAVLLGFLLLRRDPDARDTERLLADAALAAAGARPDLFADFRPFDSSERRALDAPVRRGGLALHRPAGKVFEVRPRFRWTGWPGGGPALLALYRADGTELWRAAAGGGEMDFPAERAPLRPGESYVWRVSGRGPLGAESGERTFAVTTPTERADLREAAEAIGQVAPEGYADLVFAHYALRGDYLAEAERAARAFVQAHPGDRVGRETLHAVLRLLGKVPAGPPDGEE